MRLASKLIGWDINIMTPDELNEVVERAHDWFRQIPNVSTALSGLLVAKGLLSYQDLASLKPDELANLASVTYQQAEAILRFAAERNDKDNLW